MMPLVMVAPVAIAFIGGYACVVRLWLNWREREREREREATLTRSCHGSLDVDDLGHVWFN